MPAPAHRLSAEVDEKTHWKPWIQQESLPSLLEEVYTADIEKCNVYREQEKKLEGTLVTSDPRVH